MNKILRSRLLGFWRPLRSASFGHRPAKLWRTHPVARAAHFCTGRLTCAKQPVPASAGLPRPTPHVAAPASRAARRIDDRSDGRSQTMSDPRLFGGGRCEMQEPWLLPLLSLGYVIMNPDPEGGVGVVGDTGIKRSTRRMTMGGRGSLHNILSCFSLEKETKKLPPLLCFLISQSWLD